MKALIVPLACMSLLSGCVVHVGGSSNGPTVSTERQLSLDAAGIEHLSIENGAGKMRIVGVEGMSTIEVDAQIHTPESRPDSYELRLDSSGRRAVLVGDIEYRDGLSFHVGGSAKVDLTVRMPKRLALTIDDGSGSVEIDNVAGDVDIEDGSGSLALQSLGGDLKIDDGSGHIEIHRVSGNVDIDDNSGGITISQVGGDVDIEDDSGHMVIEDVTGRVTVDDGSGDIEISRAGDVKIIESGSGDVSVDRG